MDYSMKSKSAGKLGNFLSSFGAAVHLSQKAKTNGFFIEQVCLFANIIDGLLRLSLLIKEQLDTKSDSINQIYLFQSDQAKIISERRIYNIALDKKIIGKRIFNQLESLYLLRNKIIHRYIISGIKTLLLKKTAFEYDKMMDKVLEKHRPYHDKIVSKNIGLAKYLINNPTLDQITNQILKKHKGLYKKKP